jgi:hypothetical protein
MPSALACIGLAIADGRAAPLYDAAIGLQRAEQHLHQRRLAGAVLAQQGVDLTRRDLEIDGVIRLERAENLRDALDFQEGLRRGCRGGGIRQGEFPGWQNVARWKLSAFKRSAQTRIQQ